MPLQRELERGTLAPIRISMSVRRCSCGLRGLHDPHAVRQNLTYLPTKFRWPCRSSLVPSGKDRNTCKVPVRRPAFTTSAYLCRPEKNEENGSVDWERDLGQLLPPMRAGWMPSGEFEQAPKCETISAQMTENDKILSICYRDLSSYTLQRLLNVMSDSVECDLELKEALERLGSITNFSPPLMTLYGRIEAHKQAMLAMKDACRRETVRFATPEGISSFFRISPLLIPTSRPAFYLAMATVISVPAIAVTLILSIATGGAGKIGRDD